LVDNGSGNIVFVMTYPVAPAAISAVVAVSVNFYQKASTTPIVLPSTKADTTTTETLSTPFTINSIQAIANCVTANNTASCTWPITVYFADTCINSIYSGINGNLALTYNTQTSTAINLKSSLLNVNMPACANGSTPTCTVNTSWFVNPQFSTTKTCTDTSGPTSYQLGTTLNLKITSNINTTKFIMFGAFYALTDSTGVIYTSPEQKPVFTETQNTGFNCYQWTVPVATDVIKNGVYQGNIRSLIITMTFQMQTTLRYLQGNTPILRYLQTPSVSNNANIPIGFIGNTYISANSTTTTTTTTGVNSNSHGSSIYFGLLAFLILMIFTF